MSYWTPLAIVCLLVVLGVVIFEKIRRQKQDDLKKYGL